MKTLFSRRAFSGMCASALSFGTRFLRAGESIPLTWVSQPEAGAGLERRYRADAQVVLLSIPVLHRSGVGDGAAIWRESIAEDGAAMRLLEFTGRSIPEHAAGLNRFGFIQELSRTVDRTYKEALYFGLMTASPEESAAEARKALHSDKTEAAFSAIDARIAANTIETTGAHFIAPSRTSAADRQALIERARQALLGAPKKKEDLPSNKPTPRPFLHAMADLLSQPHASQTEYQYNGRMYILRVERAPDPKAAAAFREQRLIAPTAAVTRISGTLRRQGGDKPIEFRVWTEEGAARPIPLRIEYQPKSYLRLTFEALS
jgi:hypothetical protein